MVSRIMFVISSLEMGGAQRILSLLANSLVRPDREVSIITLEGEDAEPAFPLLGAIHVQRLNLSSNSGGIIQAVVNNVRRVRALRTAIQDRNPQIVLAFMEQTSVLSVLACLGTDIPVVCCERTNPELHSVGLLWDGLRRLTYPLAECVTFQTERTADALPWVDNYVVIPNPVRIPEDHDCPDCPTAPFVICLGRLSHEKGFDLFLQAFAESVQNCPDWQALILGDGPERDALETFARQLGVRDKVHFAGAVDHVGGYLRRSDLFVLPSRFEGFPSSLCEAMACGTAVVAFDCPTGPREIIRDGYDGVLVPPGDVTGLAREMGALMRDADKRMGMGDAARAISGRFNQLEIVKRWEDLVSQVVWEKIK